MTKSARRRRRPPNGPFVEPSFYFDQLTTAEAFFLVIDVLVSMGASVSGDVVFGTGEDLDSTADPVFGPLESVDIDGCTELERLAKAKQRPVVGVTLSNFSMAPSGRDIIVRVLPIPEFAVGKNRHPIVIWADGRAFEPYVSPSTRRRTAETVSRIFLDLVDRCSPSYAAVLMSWPLPCPLDVAAKPSAEDFLDSYVSEEYLGRSAVSRISAAAGEAAQKIPDRGILMFTSGLLLASPLSNSRDVAE